MGSATRGVQSPHTPLFGPGTDTKVRLLASAAALPTYTASMRSHSARMTLSQRDSGRDQVGGAHEGPTRGGSAGLLVPSQYGR